MRVRYRECGVGQCHMVRINSPDMDADDRGDCKMTSGQHDCRRTRSKCGTMGEHGLNDRGNMRSFGMMQKRSIDGML